MAGFVVGADRRTARAAEVAVSVAEWRRGGGGGAWHVREWARGRADSIGPGARWLAAAARCGGVAWSDDGEYQAAATALRRRRSAGRGDVTAEASARGWRKRRPRQPEGPCGGSATALRGACTRVGSAAETGSSVERCGVGEAALRRNGGYGRLETARARSAAAWRQARGGTLCDAKRSAASDR